MESLTFDEVAMLRTGRDEWFEDENGAKQGVERIGFLKTETAVRLG